MNWIPVWLKMPNNGQEVMVTGNSGYNKPYDKFYINAHIDRAYRGTDWLDATGTRLSDSGWAPTHWSSELFQLAKSVVEVKPALKENQNFISKYFYNALVVRCLVSQDEYGWVFRSDATMSLNSFESEEDAWFHGVDLVKERLVKIKNAKEEYTILNNLPDSDIKNRLVIESTQKLENLLKGMVLDFDK